MHDPSRPLHCVNRDCQAANPSDRRFCQQCNTPLVRRYLWAIGAGIEAYPCPALIGDRYLHLHPRLFLDTRPAQPPQLPHEVPTVLVPYLRLFPLRPHIPQVYGQLPTLEEPQGPPLWLLEYGLFSRSIQFSEGELLPSLTACWPEASPLRQLHWLWQLAQLWPDCARQGVARSLLTPEVLRVNGATVQLRELRHDDPEDPPQLAQLGDLWLQWLPASDPSLGPGLKRLCDHLRTGQLSSQHLLASLDQLLAACGQGQTRAYDLFACTDTGKVRQHNEDACYPDQAQMVKASPQALVIVCDGIGGHDGGEIASNLAIAALRDGVQPLLTQPQPEATPLMITEVLEHSICKANDLISDRNDSEQRQERRRMGTTLVMAMSYAHELYLTHVGDSRIYQISADSCQQLTLDDDVASREVRLGYALYRDALTHPSAGALIQALGMAHSSRLRPTVRRLVVDSDCVLLLCSDGLSDRDRVEQYWETEILPVLQGITDVRTASERLLNIANQRNGHDNITIALVACQVRDRPGEHPSPLPLPQVAEIPEPEPTQPPEPADTDKSDDTWPGWTPALLLLLGLAAGLSLLSYASFPELRAQVQRWLGETAGEERPEPLAPRPSRSPSDLFAVGNWLAAREGIALHRNPQATAPTTLVPAASLLYVSRRQALAEQGTWVRLQVCPQPGAASPLAGWLETDGAADQVEPRAAETIPADCREPGL